MKKKWTQMPEEEKRRLIALAQGGDTKARNDLIVADLPFIRNTTHKLVRRKQNWTEFVCVAVEGYIRAIKTFDLDRKISFVTYAHQAIKWKVLRAEHDFRIIRLPVLVTQKQKSRAAATNRIALAGGSFWGEAFADHSDPGASLEDAENLDSVYDFLIDMNERDRKILIGRMRGEKLHEIAARHGFSKERIRQIVRDNINEMRERLCPA